MKLKNENLDVYEGSNWGLPMEAINQLGDRLKDCWERFRNCFKTKTRDTSQYAYDYLSGQLRLDNERNFANISREAGVETQNMQHFMSNSPWSAQSVYKQVQEEIRQTPGLENGGALILDESANEKAGERSAGARKQYNGRLGKVETSQVGVLLGYANLTVEQSLWTWVEGDLFLPEAWFDEEHAPLRQQLGIPNERQFETKVELGWKVIQRVHANHLPFEVVACDCLYGKSSWLRHQLREARLNYMAEIPSDTLVYLNKPRLGVPDSREGQRGRRPSRIQVVSEEKPVRVDSLVNDPATRWQEVEVRTTERGKLCDPFAARRVWTVYEDQAVEEWLVMRQESEGKNTFALSHAPIETTLSQLAWWKCQRYFIERANQDAKSELGWDELEAQKYRAWEHHLALTILASWFIAQTKYEWAKTYQRQPELLQQLEVDILPSLSVANLRLLLRAVMPLRQLTSQQAVSIVIEHLLNRTHSRKSRIKNQVNLDEKPG